MLPWDSRAWAAPLADPAYRAEVWERLLANVKVTEAGCWEWQRYRNSLGYGTISVKRAMKCAHQIAKVIAMGGLYPRDMFLDHLCRNTSCCNPDHLEVVTPRENTIRGISPQLTRERILARTHCPQGHPYDEANTRIRRGGFRDCRACERARDLEPRTCPDCGIVVTRCNLRRHRASRNCVANDKPICGAACTRRGRPAHCNRPVAAAGDRCWDHSDDVAA